MKQNKIMQMCLTGVFTALIFVFTAYLHIPSYNGYTHIGDGFIFLCACLLPRPYAMFAGAVGALLADCLSGYALWAPASLAIKAVTVLFFCNKRSTIINARNLLALIPAGMLCIGGYYLYEVCLTGNWIAPAPSMIGYLVQSVLSSVLFVIAGSMLDKLSIHKLNGGKRR